MSRPAAALALAFALGPLTLGPGSSRAAIVAPPPGREVRVLEEHVLVVFDPLTATQTLVVYHVFEGATTPFGLLVPTPRPAKCAQQPERLRTAIRARLQPRGKVQRTLDVEFTSLLRSCAVRAVGDDATEADDGHRPERARATATNLGSAPEPLHDWLLQNGFTLAPAQAAWLAQLRDRNWAITGIVVHPPSADHAPAPRILGPIITLSHPAEEPTLAIHHPPFDLDEQTDQAIPPIEVAVLTEWAVNLDLDDAPAPFFADALSEREITRLSNDAGGLPWAFRRNGTLTAFRLDRPAAKRVLHFERGEPRTPRRPSPTPRERAHRFKIPIELVGVLAWLAYLGLRRYGRGLRGRRLDA